MPNGDAHTYAIYRDVVVSALAQWLVEKPTGKAKEARLAMADAAREQLTKTLEQMRGNDPQLHLRIAAWNVFVKAAELREKQEQEED